MTLLPLAIFLLALLLLGFQTQSPEAGMVEVATFAAIVALAALTLLACRLASLVHRWHDRRWVRRPVPSPHESPSPCSVAVRNVVNAYRNRVARGELSPSDPVTLVVSPGFAAVKLTSTNAFGVSAIDVLRRTFPAGLRVEVRAVGPEFDVRPGEGRG